MIQKDVQVRLKLVGTRVDATEIVSEIIKIIFFKKKNAQKKKNLLQFAIGTIKEDYLGVISS